MKKILIFLILPFIHLSCFSGSFQRPENVEKVEGKDFYDLTARDMNGQEVSMSQYKGKKILIVNVASKCGYTPQYDDLQKLYAEKKDELVILGFPCNDFGGQEPGTNEEIVEFCRINYDVNFPLFDKITLKGADRPELYQWLTDKDQNGWNDEVPNWNFCKYLINEKGELTNFFRSRTKPYSDEMIAALEN